MNTWKDYSILDKILAIGAAILFGGVGLVCGISYLIGGEEAPQEDKVEQVEEIEK